MKRNHDATQSPESVVEDLRTLVSQAEKMIAESTPDNGELLDNIRERLAAAQERMGDLYDGAKKKITAGAKRTDEVIRANPYQSLAVALGAGVLLGVVLARRRS